MLRESAIIMLADSVEAAGRSLRKVTPQAIDDLTAKGLPGLRLKLPLDRIHQAFHHIFVVFSVPYVANAAGVFRQLVELVKKTGLPGGSWPVLPRTPIVAQSMYQNGAQPTAKRTRSTVVFELGQFAHQDGEHFLKEILSIGMLHLVSLEPPPQQRCIQLHQPIPRLGIRLLANSIQEAERSLVHRSAESISPLCYHRT